jgi:hypothetical protein
MKLFIGLLTELRGPSHEIEMKAKMRGERWKGRERGGKRLSRDM